MYGFNLGFGIFFAGSREGRAGPCSAPSSPTSSADGQQIVRNAHRGSKCNSFLSVLYGACCGHRLVVVAPGTLIGCCRAYNYPRTPPVTPLSIPTLSPLSRLCWRAFCFFIIIIMIIIIFIFSARYLATLLLFDREFFVFHGSIFAFLYNILLLHTVVDKKKIVFFFVHHCICYTDIITVITEVINDYNEGNENLYKIWYLIMCN